MDIKELCSNFEFNIDEEEQKLRTIALIGGRQSGKTCIQAMMNRLRDEVNVKELSWNFDQMAWQEDTMTLPGNRIRRNEEGFMSSFDALIEKCKVKKCQVKM